MKIHLGCGSHHIHGWLNHDLEVDIRKRLPWRNEEVDFIFAEHVIEHVTFPEGVRFLTECRRVLNRNGVLRFSFPDAELVNSLSEPELNLYFEATSAVASRCIEKTYLPLKTREDCLRLLFCGWGHLSAWTVGLARIALRVAGFGAATPSAYGVSMVPELRGVDGHHEQSPAAALQTSVLEARGYWPR